MPPGNVNLEIKKILIFRFSSLGDIIMATAMVRNIRKAFPQAQIDMVVRKDFFDLIKLNPHLNNKIGLEKKQGFKGLLDLLKKINLEKYDLVYDAHRSLRTRLLMPFIKAKYKAYFKKEYLKRSLALTFKLRILSSKRMLEKYIDPLIKFGVTYDSQGPEIFPPSTLTTEKKLIGIIPSAQWPGKRWPIEYFRKVLEMFIEKTENNLVVFGGPEDTFCKKLCEGLPNSRVENLQGKLGLLQTTEKMTRCIAFIANDTGLMHIADALNKPNILILGPTSAEMGCLPFSKKSIVLEKNLWCRPCSKNGQAPCIRLKRYCLTEITPELVFQQTQKLLLSL